VSATIEKELNMGAAKTVAKLAAIGAAIGGVIFFWRKKHAHDEQPVATTPFPPAADRGGEMP
jgi:hypothetical protein